VYDVCEENCSAQTTCFQSSQERKPDIAKKKKKNHWRKNSKEDILRCVTTACQSFELQIVTHNSPVFSKITTELEPL
jgi:hypothetical protein